MPLLDDRVKKQVQGALNAITQPIKLVVFTQGEGGALECAFCGETRQLVEEVGKLSDKVEVEVRDFQADEELAKTYGVDKIPAIVMLSGGAQPKHHGIRFYGIPSGYEFSSFIEGLRMVGSGQATLSAATQEAIKKLTQPVHLQVFVTPTWPYCPRAVVLAHKLAFASEQVAADMVEVSEFPHLATKYQVYGVPRTVINEVIHIEGAVPESALVAELMKVEDPAAMEHLRAAHGKS